MRLFTYKFSMSVRAENKTPFFECMFFMHRKIWFLCYIVFIVCLRNVFINFIVLQYKNRNYFLNNKVQLLLFFEKLPIKAK